MSAKHQDGHRGLELEQLYNLYYCIGKSSTTWLCDLFEPYPQD